MSRCFADPTDFEPRCTATSSRHRQTKVTVILVAVLWFLPADLSAQPVSDDDAGMVQLTLPPETELKTLIDYVSQRLQIKFIYDNAVEGKKVSIRAPAAIPTDSLLEVLESALRMNNLAVVDADVEGWKRITEVKDLASIAVQAGDRPLGDFFGGTAITNVFSLTHTTPDQITAIIKPFLTTPGSNTITVADRNLLIVTDFAGNLSRISNLIQTLDQAGPQRSLEFLSVDHLDAAELAQQISQALATQAPAQPGESAPVLSPDERTNQILVVGTPDQIEAVRSLARALDVSLDQIMEFYDLKFVDAERIDRLVRDVLDPRIVDRLYRSSIDREDNLLIVTASREIHEQVQWFVDRMDIESRRPDSALQIYRLKYADAVEVLNTIRAIDVGGPGFGPGRPSRGVSPLGRGGVGNSRNIGSGESPIDFVPGANQPDQPGQPPPSTPALRESESGTSFQPPFGNGPPQRFGQAASRGSIVPGQASISVDPNSNSIIVIADRAVQEIYKSLIDSLDKRRPQVMIEARVVILDTTDDFVLGVEMSAPDAGPINRLINFTSFGLSTVDPVSGSLSLIPGRGYNFALVDPDDANAIIRALATHRRAKVTSAPRILVNDNATGTLASVTEVPFTSVNASNTVATTSFAGFAEAGTTIDVTPRITDDDHLEMDFSVSLNSFTGPGGDGIPPPRQTDQVTSSVTVPDGYSIVVGGLTRKNYSQMRDAVPFLEDIPGIRELAGTQSKAQSQTTLFVFLKPVILRDDKFRDLKFLSDRDLTASTEPGNYPQPVALLMGVQTADGPKTLRANRPAHPWTRPVNENRVLPERPFIRRGLLGWPAKQ